MLPLNSSLACSPHILANVGEMPSTKIVENVMQFLIVLLFNSNKTELKYDNEPDSWHGGHMEGKSGAELAFYACHATNLVL